METIQKNKLALDLHDSAKSYYERSQEYGYKFLMSLKQIRDEKLFLDLGCSEFEEYTENYFGYSKRTINERIQIAQSWGSDYERALASYGKHKARQLGLLPEIERENLIERGIPTENGVKSIDEATTREIEAYKRQLKAKDEQLSLQAKMIEDLNEQETQVIEKEVVIEKIPDDYESTKNLNSDLLNKNRHLNYDNENLQRVIKIKEHELKKLEDDSHEAIALKETIESLRTDKEKLEGTYKNAMELSSLLSEFENFFDEKMAPLRFKAVIAGLGTDFQLKKLRDILTLVDSWLTEMNKVVPDEGRKIIEGEIING